MARLSFTYTLAAVLAVAVLTTPVAAAQTAPPEGDSQALKAMCKQGGYRRVVGVRIGDPNEVFRNQGQCVSFVNHGGRLVGISDPED